MPSSVDVTKWEESLTPSGDALLDDVVLEYFRTEGMYEEAVQFCQESHAEMTDEDVEELRTRSACLRAVETGDTYGVLKMLNTIDPSFLASNSAVSSSLTILRFVEILRAPDPSSLMQALSFARSEFTLLSSRLPAALPLVEEAMTLLLLHSN